jgi:site-specific recombinase XerD
VSAFVSSLMAKNVSASTQNQTLSAVLFLYEVILGRRLGWMDSIVRAQRPARLPVVLSREEVVRVLSRLHGTMWLMASLLHESVLQRAVKEAARLAGLQPTAARTSIRGRRG